jgi:hypothetical protein
MLSLEFAKPSGDIPRSDTIFRNPSSRALASH